MNGRLFAHFLAQLFLWLPLPIFKLCNTLMLLSEVFLIVKIGGKSKYDIVLVPFAFFSLWLFELSFGQVNFWLDGACNYLWSATASLLFLYPFAMHFLYDRVIANKSCRVLFVIFGFFVGNFMENSSAATIFMACVFLLLLKFYQKKKLRAEEIGSVVTAVIGFIVILLAPAELQNKISVITPGILRERFIAAWEMLSAFSLLIFLFAILLVLSYHAKVEKNACILSMLLALGALCSHFIMIFASYYPDRCAAFTVVLFTSATITLLRELLKTDQKTFLCCAISIVLLLGVYHLVLGVNDIYITHRNMEENIERIEEAKRDGLSQVDLPIVTPTTKYSAIYGLRYLSEDPYDWPNADMACYHGITFIVGYYP